MINNDIKIGSNRNFGIVFFIFFFILFLYTFLSTNNPKYILLIVSFVFLFLGLLNSKILTPLNLIWFKLGLFLGKIVSPIVMGIIFFLIVTPTGIIMRLIGKDLLNLKNKNSKTYWIKKNILKSSMRNQF